MPRGYSALPLANLGGTFNVEVGDPRARGVRYPRPCPFCGEDLLSRKDRDAHVGIGSRANRRAQCAAIRGPLA